RTNMNKPMKTIFWTILTLTLPGFVASGFAQEVTIPDPGLNAAIRETLHQAGGPLTQQDLLSLTNLDACRRNIRSIDGLETARNLISLDLQINRLTNFALPGTLTKLIRLDLSVNSMTNCFIPGAMTNLASLILEGNSLRHLSLPANLTGLTNLE